MNVEPHECTWPVCRAAFATTKDDPSARVPLASTANRGELVSLPELYVCGRIKDGSAGVALLGGYTLNHAIGLAELVTENETRREWGRSGVAKIALEVKGGALELVATGSDETILWAVYWRAVDFPANVAG